MTRRSLSARVYDDLLGRIQRGEIGRDDRLVDTSLAAERGISRMPVREALMRLVAEGYLVGTSRGFMLPDLSACTILELFELRRLLEPHAAATAAQAMDGAAVAALAAAVDEGEAALAARDLRGFYRASQAFRDGWLRAVPNRELQATIHRYLIQVQAVRMATMRDGPTQRVILDGQKALMAAFEARDAVAAGVAMLRFVLAGEAAYRALAAPASPPPEST
jgi:DNA-binding GntR family transcriptional regulator